MLKNRLETLLNLPYWGQKELFRYLLNIPFSFLKNIASPYSCLIPNNNAFNICWVATGGNLKFGNIGSQK